MPSATEVTVPQYIGYNNAQTHTQTRIALDKLRKIKHLITSTSLHVESCTKKLYLEYLLFTQRIIDNHHHPNGRIIISVNLE